DCPRSISGARTFARRGGQPEFVAVDEPTATMDEEKLGAFLEQECHRNASGRLVSKRTGHPVTGIVPVHLYGHPAPMDPIMEMAERYNLVVIEDACQAHGAEYFSERNNRSMK